MPICKVVTTNYASCINTLTNVLDFVKGDKTSYRSSLAAVENERYPRDNLKVNIVDKNATKSSRQGAQYIAIYEYRIYHFRA